MAIRSLAYAKLRGATVNEQGLRVADAMAREDTGTASQRARQIADRGADLRHHTGSALQPGPAPASSWTSAGQLDLAGNVTPSAPPPTPPAPAPAASGQQLALPVTVPRQYRSEAWGGTVTETPFDLSGEG